MRHQSFTADPGDRGQRGLKSQCVIVTGSGRGMGLMHNSLHVGKDHETALTWFEGLESLGYFRSCHPPHSCVVALKAPE